MLKDWYMTLLGQWWWFKYTKKLRYICWECTLKTWNSVTFNDKFWNYWVIVVWKLTLQGNINTVTLNQHCLVFIRVHALMCVCINAYVIVCACSHVFAFMCMHISFSTSKTWKYTTVLIYYNSSSSSTHHRYTPMIQKHQMLKSAHPWFKNIRCWKVHTNDWWQAFVKFYCALFERVVYIYSNKSCCLHTAQPINLYGMNRQSLKDLHMQCKCKKTNLYLNKLK